MHKSWRRTPRVCTLEGCGKVDIEGKSICQMHRKRMKRTGTYEERVPTSRAVPVPPDPSPRACIECGSIFTMKARRVCSQSCRDARAMAWVAIHRPPRARRVETCPHCGLMFETAKPMQRHCSSQCGNRARHSRRRAVEAGAYVEDVWRSRVYERDGYVCQLCHKPVKMGQVVPHPKAPTLDHVLPLSAGGTHEYANVQLAHFLCNSRKSAGDAQLVLALHSHAEGGDRRTACQSALVPATRRTRTAAPSSASDRAGR
jgi:5-methylcytosine-specific restriction endonuclease McrA